jgi:hypothetical protein
MRVSLTEEELLRAKERGRQLKEVNLETRDTPAYSDQSRKVYKDEADAGFVMSVAECAVAKATGREWHAKVWPRSEHHKHKDEPDVGRNIEVRHVTHPSAGLVVRQKDLNRDKVLFLAYPDPATEFREVEVIGWMKAEDAWENGTPVDDYRRVRQSLLSTKLP